MVLKNLGSIATEIGNMVDNIPTSISGATLMGIIDRKRLYMEEFLEETIGSVDIAEKYQPALTNMSMGDLLSTMNIQGADISSIKLGDFSENKGGQSNLIASADRLEAQGVQMMKQLKMKFRGIKVWGV
jgi:hypothetical protein|tara:strand:+ start:5587 stop:5973 length:387 start_codon:yes stop_codon:yes gene_type:complete